MGCDLTDDESILLGDVHFVNIRLRLAEEASKIVGLRTNRTPSSDSVPILLRLIG